MTREELIARLEGLTGSNRETDAEIVRFVSGVASKFDLVIATPYTGSVDAVLALIQERLPGSAWEIWFNPKTGIADAKLHVVASQTDDYPNGSHIRGCAATPQLALLAATLRALG